MLKIIMLLKLNVLILMLSIFFVLYITARFLYTISSIPLKPFSINKIDKIVFWISISLIVTYILTGLS